MKFNFKIRQYQTDAVNAVVKVFQGQGYHDKISYIRDLGKQQQSINFDGTVSSSGRQLSFEEPTRFIFSHSALREGWDNPILLLPLRGKT